MPDSTKDELRPGDLVEIDPEYGFHPVVERIEGSVVHVTFLDVEQKEHTIAFPRAVLRKV